MSCRWHHYCIAFLIFATACEVGDGDWDDAGWDGSFPDSGRDAAVRPEDDAGDEDAGQISDASSHDAAADTGVAPTDAGLPDKPDSFAQLLATASCGALAKCMGPRLLMDSLSGQDCVSYRTHLYEDRDLHWLPKAVTQGRVAFNPERLSQCASDLTALGCEVQTRRLPQSCLDVAKGDVEVDGACAIDQECAGRAFCDKGSLETCPGTCASLQTAGLPCRATAQCVDGLVCRSSVCTAPLSEGDECTVAVTAPMGTGFRECPPGLVCQGKSNSLRCMSISSVYTAKEGQDCDATGTLCELGLVCRSKSATTTAGVCSAVVAREETCRPAVPSQCQSGQYCKDARSNVTTRAPAGTDGVCADLPSGGDACEASVGCQPGAVCLDDDMCRDLKTVGKACDDSRECYGGSCLAQLCSTPLDCSM